MGPIFQYISNPWGHMLAPILSHLGSQCVRRIKPSHKDCLHWPKQALCGLHCWATFGCSGWQILSPINNPSISYTGLTKTHQHTTIALLDSWRPMTIPGWFVYIGPFVIQHGVAYCGLIWTRADKPSWYQCEYSMLVPLRCPCAIHLRNNVGMMAR